MKNQISILTEHYEYLLHDFTLINHIVNHYTNHSIKNIQKKCKILNYDQVQKAVNNIKMAKVRAKKPTALESSRRTKKQIRTLIVGSLSKVPTLSIYQLSKETGLSFSVIKTFIHNDNFMVIEKDGKKQLKEKEEFQKMLRVAKTGSATYLSLKEDFRI